MSRWVQISESICQILLSMLAFTMFLVVVLRYFFDTGFVWMQDLVTYFHSILFLVSAGLILHFDEHVRVDLFYHQYSEKKKALVNFLGILFFLFPMLFMIAAQSYPYVSDSISIREESVDAGGLPFVYILKSFILVYVFVLLIHGLEKIIKSYQILRRS